MQKIIYIGISLVISVAYFQFLDWFLMDTQDFFPDLSRIEATHYQPPFSFENIHRAKVCVKFFNTIQFISPNHLAKNIEVIQSLRVH